MVDGEAGRARHSANDAQTAPGSRPAPEAQPAGARVEDPSQVPEGAGNEGRPARASPTWLRVAVFTVAIFLTSTMGIGSGIGAALLRDHGSEEAATKPLAFYITDAPAQLSSLNVKIASVTAGPDRVPLQVIQSSFDLAALQGPDAAILLAQGDVPSDAAGRVEVTFASAQATIDGHTFDVPLAQTLVVEDLGSGASPAFLLDVDLASSLSVDQEGRLRFAPVATNVFSGPSPISGTAPDWTRVQTKSPTIPSGLEPAGIQAPRGHDWADQAPDGPLTGNQSGEAPAANVPEESIEVRVPVIAGADFEDGVLPGWLVLFSENETLGLAHMQAVIAGAGATFVSSLQSLPVAYVLATKEQAHALANHVLVERVEAEVALEYHDAESRPAIRLPDLTHPVTGLRDASGYPVTGRGVGVAVVDTGIDALHPAFQTPELIDPVLRQELPGESVVAENLKVVSNAYVPLPNTDTTSGHGTHVAAIVAGQHGADDALPGVAPGASLYGLGVGEAKTIVWAAEAFDWILQHHDEVDPPIRVVTNSWGSSGPHDPNAVLTRLVNRMVGEGIVVVFSAGNNGGDGMYAETSSQCQIPTPGVVCVAAYDDLGTGTRDGTIAEYSSRGWLDDPATWPDISAPGTSIRSARTLAGTVTGVGVYQYVELSGTSQAAPHVAGVAALLLQADASLSPAEVETVLKATAHPFSDGGASDSRGHYAKGHGLVDAYAAVAQVD